VLDVYNQVIADGRYVGEFLDNPSAVAKKLDLKISRGALAVLGDVAARMAGTRAAVGAAIAVISVSVVAIAVTTAIVSSVVDPRARILVDESGMVKLGDPFNDIREAAARRRAKSNPDPTKKKKRPVKKRPVR